MNKCIHFAGVRRRGGHRDMQASLTRGLQLGQARSKTRESPLSFKKVYWWPAAVHKVSTKENVRLVQGACRVMLLASWQALRCVALSQQFAMGEKYTLGEVIMGDSGMLEAIRWQMGPPATLRLLDQRLLPAQSVYIEIDGPQAAYTAIKVVLTCLNTFESALVRLDCKAMHQITWIVLRRSLTQGSAVSYSLLGRSDVKIAWPAEKRQIV